jgi:hypothetical protein
MAQDNSAHYIHKLAERSLQYLSSNGIAFSRFSTNLAEGVREKGNTVRTRLAGSLTAQDKSTPGKIAKQDANLSAVTVTLDKVAAVKIGANDLERSYSDLQLEDEFIAPAFEALNEQVMSDVLGLATTANGFDTDQTDVDVTAFTADTMANIARKLSDNKVPHANRSALLSPALIESLTTDGAIQNASSFGDNSAVREGRVARVSGIDTFEYTGNIPTNSENMIGIVAHPQAFAIAAREIAEPEPGTWYGQVRSAVDSVTGLPFQIRRYYDTEDEEQVVEWQILYGVAVGQVAAGVRIIDTP